ncbi:MAG: hypothetical protein COB02_13740 [Candidatus Cloacimonadota bacterium]|nr:MAG: hypothetical protein COB02_13740 [Candidatus Cloacimonadota bacterium]
MAVLQLKTNDLVDKMNIMMSSHLKISEFELKSIEKEIQEVRKISMSEYLMLKGILYSIKNDVVQCINSFESSLTSKFNLTCLSNYKSVMIRLNNIEKIAEIYERYYEVSQEDPDFLINYSTDLSLLGRFDESIKYFNKYKKLVNLTNENNDFLNDLSIFLVKNTRFNSEVSKIIIAEVFENQQNKNIFAESFVFNINFDLESPLLTYMIKIKCSKHDLLSLQYDVDQILNKYSKDSNYFDVEYFNEEFNSAIDKIESQDLLDSDEITKIDKLFFDEIDDLLEF